MSVVHSLSSSAANGIAADGQCSHNEEGVSLLHETVLLHLVVLIAFHYLN